MKEDAEIRARALELALTQVAPGEKFGPTARLADVYAKYIAGGAVPKMVTTMPEQTGAPAEQIDDQLPDF